MQNLTFAKDLITETLATEYIFNACRANPERLLACTWHVNGRDTVREVSFTRLIDGTHEACLRNSDGIVVALAQVDSCDI
jgi:hypothetical protein